MAPGLSHPAPRREWYAWHNHRRQPLYDLWSQALLASDAEAASEWDEATASAWREVLEFVIGFMTARY